MVKTLTATQMANKWGITPKRVAEYCNDGRISNAVKTGNVWMIPEDSERPSDMRKLNTQNSPDCDATELRKTIWNIANDLRGSVDGWDFKMYVLNTIFYRYLSEKLETMIDTNEHEAGNAEFMYSVMKDSDAADAKKSIIDECGYFISPSNLFRNMVSYTGEDISEKLHGVFSEIESSASGTPSEAAFSGLFADFDFTSNKLGGTAMERMRKIRKLLSGVQSMQLESVDGAENDTFGDAYEYLMGLYSANAGKVGGEYFTPQGVSALLTEIVTYGKDSVRNIYDMTCGSGSLLLTPKRLGVKVRDGYYGQEINPTTYNLCRMNMLLHGVPYDKFNIFYGDTLTNPGFKDLKVECGVANPPYSIKWIGDDDSTLLNDARFAPAGVLAPKSKADMAFIMNMLSRLDENGTAAIVCFPGIMYRSGKEQKIRKYLIDSNFVDAVIQLPENLFFGTTIATDILVLKKNRRDNNVLFIDASDECIKATNSNRLSEENIRKIVNKVYDERTSGGCLAKEENFSRVVSYKEIVDNNYTLSVSSYIEKTEAKEKIDLAAEFRKLEDIRARRIELEERSNAIIRDIMGEVR